MDWLNSSYLKAPETAHWALTYDCHHTCPDCYSRRYSSYPLLKKEKQREIIRSLASFGVFQLALGGGEPLLFPYLEEVIGEASRNGLVVHLTTSGYGLSDGALLDICGDLSSLQLGINHGNMLADPQREEERISELVSKCKEQGLPIGANLMLSKTMLENVSQIVSLLYYCGIRRVTLLRYKPPFSVSRWREEKPDQKMLLELPVLLTLLTKRFEGLMFRVDCASSFLQSHVDPKKAKRRGLRGCVAASRIIALDPQGFVYPCSQLIAPLFKAGSVLEDDLGEMWKNNEVLRRYRSFRSMKGYSESWCGLCSASDQCGGCRVFAHDALGGDIGCPRPLRPPVSDLEKKRAVKEQERSLWGIEGHLGKESDIFEGNKEKTIDYKEEGYPMSEESVEVSLEQKRADYPKWLSLLKGEVLGEDY